MSAPLSVPGYSPLEERLNSLTHAVGFVFATAGLVVLVVFAALRGTAWHVVASSVYGATLMLAFAASTLYHSVRRTDAKRLLRAFDHSAIFLLIAGTYTPFTLVTLRGPWGWSLFGTIWGLAVLGITLRFTVRRGRLLFLALYLAMGWAVVVAAKPLTASLAPGGLALLGAGGLMYTVGVAFYVWKNLPMNHAIWHVFVLAGAMLHYFAVLFFVIPITGAR